jgi:hypothetical protein
MTRDTLKAVAITVLLMAFATMMCFGALVYTQGGR